MVDACLPGLPLLHLQLPFQSVDLFLQLFDLVWVRLGYLGLVVADLLPQICLGLPQLLHLFLSLGDSLVQLGDQLGILIPEPGNYEVLLLQLAFQLYDLLLKEGGCSGILLILGDRGIAGYCGLGVLVECLVNRVVLLGRHIVPVL